VGPDQRRDSRYPASIDWSLFHTVNSGVALHDWLEDPVTVLAGLAVPLYAVATLALWLLDRPYGRLKWKLASASALGAAALALLANQLVSHVWDRPRPFAAHEAGTHLLAAPSPDPSFPSDHAAAAFAIAFAVLAFSRWGGVAFLGAASFIAVSRVALGLHYPSDVVAGLVVGWAAAMFVTGIGRRWITPLVSALSRLTDPMLAPLWTRLGRRRLANRF